MPPSLFRHFSVRLGIFSLVLSVFSCPPSDCFTTHRLGSIQFSSHLNLFIPPAEDLLPPFFFFFHFPDDGTPIPSPQESWWRDILLFFSFFSLPSIRMDGCCRATNSMTSVTPSYNSCYCSCLKCWNCGDRSCPQSPKPATMEDS